MKNSAENCPTKMTSKYSWSHLTQRCIDSEYTRVLGESYRKYQAENGFEVNEHEHGPKRHLLLLIVPVETMRND